MLPPVLRANWDPHLTQPHHHDTCTFPLQHHPHLSDHPMPKAHFSCGEVVQSYSWPSHVESGKTKILLSSALLPARGGCVTSFLSMRHKKSAFWEVGYEKHFFPAGRRQESALNTDVMSGGTQHFFLWQEGDAHEGTYLRALIRREKLTPIYLSHCKPVFSLLLVIKVFFYW